MAEYTTSIEIAAPRDRVFDHLVTPAGMTAWMGQHAVLRPEPGGTFAVDIAGHAVRGRYLHVERPGRVVVSWGVTGSGDLPPGASTVEFRLTETASGTRVDLVHRGLPDAQHDGHADGWTHFLPRLRIVASGGDAGDDAWRPVDRPAQLSHPNPSGGPPMTTVDRVRALLAAEPSTREIRMFGGVSFMVDDKMVVNVRRAGDLLVRVDPRRSPELVAQHGARRTEMGAGRDMGPGWLHVDAGLVATDDEVRAWLDIAIGFIRRTTDLPGGAPAVHSSGDA